MSSTAIVLKILSERIELDTTHGQKIFSALLFQDLAVVPIFILIPVLSQTSPTSGMEQSVWLTFIFAISKAALLFFLLLYAGKRAFSFWFSKVARTYSQEIFSLNVLLVTLGLACLTDYFGLSQALGAFVAGVLLSETEHKHRVEVDIKPFRDIFLGLFFISVGMRMLPDILLQNWYWILLLCFGFLITKGMIVFVVARLFKLSTLDGVKVAIGLAQVGEFGLMVLQLLVEQSLVPEEINQIFLAAMVLSMFLTPVLLMGYDGLDHLLLQPKSVDKPVLTEGGQQEKTKVMICGFGRSGQHLMRLLEDQGIGTVVLDLNPERVQEARNAGLNVFYADVTKFETLLSFGVEKMELLVLTFGDVALSKRVLKQVKKEIPHLPVIVRAPDDGQIETLYASGATEVVPETMEGSLMLGSHAMVRMGVPLFKVVKKVREVRDSGYELLRGFYGTDDSDSYQSLILHPIRILPVMGLSGSILKELRAEHYQLEIVSLLRERLRKNEPPPESILKDHDILVVRGTKTAIAHFENSLTMR
jgi:CPA2 family monovalent cation:H+ antiporter-2